MLADIEIFKNKINTWSEFNNSLSNLAHDKVAGLLELFNKCPPPTKSATMTNNILFTKVCFDKIGAN